MGRNDSLKNFNIGAISSASSSENVFSNARPANKAPIPNNDFVPPLSPSNASCILSSISLNLPDRPSSFFFCTLPSTVLESKLAADALASSVSFIDNVAFRIPSEESFSSTNVCV